jgi:hypothetical protein
MQRRINERPVSEKLSDGDVYTLSIVATMWCRDNVAAETPLTTTMAPTVFHVGAIQDHQAGYLRRAFRSLMSPITALDLGQDVAIARHRGDHILRKISSWPTRACASRLGVDAPLPQDGGQDNHEIAVGHQQITGGNIAVRNERFNCLSAAADQHGRLARLPKIVSRRLWLAIQQHAFGGQAEGIGFISRVIASERHLSKVSAPWLNGATSVALATLCRSGQSKCVASC